jgi:hypothetical protein
MISACVGFSDEAVIIVSLLQQIKEIDQKATILQLVDRFKSKIKELGDLQFKNIFKSLYIVIRMRL